MTDADERDVVAPLPDAPSGPQPGPPTVLTGEIQAAYHDFCYWAKQLEGLFRQHQTAQEQYRMALAKFSKLATGG
jgi:hypothetical protein